LRSTAKATDRKGREPYRAQFVHAIRWYEVPGLMPGSARDGGERRGYSDHIKTASDHCDDRPTFQLTAFRSLAENFCSFVDQFPSGFQIQSPAGPSQHHLAAY